MKTENDRRADGDEIDFWARRQEEKKPLSKTITASGVAVLTIVFASWMFLSLAERSTTTVKSALAEKRAEADDLLKKAKALGGPRKPEKSEWDEVERAGQALLKKESAWRALKKDSDSGSEQSPLEMLGGFAVAGAWLDAFDMSKSEDGQKLVLVKGTAASPAAAAEAMDKLSDLMKGGAFETGRIEQTKTGAWTFEMGRRLQEKKAESGGEGGGK